MVDEARIEFTNATSMAWWRTWKNTESRYPSHAFQSLCFGRRSLWRVDRTPGHRQSAGAGNHAVRAADARSSMLRLTDEEHVAESKQRIELILCERARVSRDWLRCRWFAKSGQRFQFHSGRLNNDADRTARCIVCGIDHSRSSLYNWVANSLRISIGTPDRATSSFVASPRASGVQA